MRDQDSSRERLLHILKYLREMTDEDNTVSIKDIIDHLKLMHISADRRTIREAINVINDSNTGFSVECIDEKGKASQFYILHEFELSELKLLADAVSASHIVNQIKTTELINKLKNQTSKQKAEQLNQQVFIHQHRAKTSKKNIYSNIDKIYNAIINNRIISFKYLAYNSDKILVPRRNGEEYLASPYFLVWSDDAYYLIAFNGYHHYNEGENADKRLAHFRVDRMDCIEEQEQKRIELRTITGKSEFDLAKYMKTLFNMYAGEVSHVEMEFTTDLLSVVIDQFGEDVIIKHIDTNHFRAILDVVITQMFLSWCFRFGNRAKIISPKILISKYKSALEDAINNT